MQHTKSNIQSEDIKYALGHLYEEIERLERKLRSLENEIDDIKVERG